MLGTQGDIAGARSMEQIAPIPSVTFGSVLPLRCELRRFDRQFRLVSRNF